MALKATGARKTVEIATSDLAYRWIAIRSTAVVAAQCRILLLSNWCGASMLWVFHDMLDAFDTPNWVFASSGKMAAAEGQK